MKIKLFCLVSALFLCLAVLAPGLLAQSAPAVALKDAVELAEKALEAEEVALDQYFLYSVALQNDSSGGFWKCSFRPLDGGDKGGYGAIFVKVYMTSKTEVAMPRVPVRYRNR